jgi:hypothetical protein
LGEKPGQNLENNWGERLAGQAAKLGKGEEEEFGRG